MALSTDSRRKLTNLGLILGPVVLVKVAASVLGTGTAGEAKAAPEPVAAPVVTPAGAAAAHPGEARAAERVRELSGIAFGASPMYYETRRSSAPVVDAPAPVAAFAVSVSMVMASKSGSVALINGKPCREGDIIEGGAWKITAIDVAARAVEFTNAETGEKHVARVPAP